MGNIEGEQTMNDNETTADIIAAMRDEGRTGESSCLEWVGAKMRDYADRFEAALKREAVIGSNKFSDCAKLREALMSEIGGYSADGLEIVWCGISGETIRKARAALSNPPRNCERFADFETAQKAYLRETKTLVVGDEMFDWLFATATDTEGGKDGNK